MAASYLWPLPSFIKTRGEMRAQSAEMKLSVNNLACRGNANLLCYFLERDDMFTVRGYLKVAAWPGDQWAQVHVIYDPSQTDENRIRQAIVEPYYEVAGDRWRMSPFAITGYDPLADIPPAP